MRADHLIVGSFAEAIEDGWAAEAAPNPPAPRSAAAEAVRARIEQGLCEQT